MRIIDYLFSDPEETGWTISPIKFRRINLLVGDSGTGKSRLLNTISALANLILAEKAVGRALWKISFSLNDIVFEYELRTTANEAELNTSRVARELLVRKDKKSDVILIDRSESNFKYNGTELPKLSNTVTGINLLKEESDISPVFNGFKSVIARRFFGDELSRQFSFFAVPPEQLANIKKTNDLLRIAVAEIGFHNKVKLLSELFPEIYGQLIAIYKDAFPFVEEFKFFDISNIQSNMSFPFPASLFCFKENSVSKFISVHDISSGMQKLFLLILDVLLMRDGGVLLIDEYENSLGINAINFLPELINNINLDCQFILTSHHPYIINTIPIESWKVFHRDGVVVNVREGSEFKEKYQESSQENFIQLINDPYYVKGIK